MIVFLVLLAVIAPIVIVAPLQDDVVLPKLVTTAAFSGAVLVWGAVLLARIGAGNTLLHLGPMACLARVSARRGSEPGRPIGTSTATAVQPFVRSTSSSKVVAIEMSRIRSRPVASALTTNHPALQPSTPATSIARLLDAEFLANLAHALHDDAQLIGRFVPGTGLEAAVGVDIEAFGREHL